MALNQNGSTFDIVVAGAGIVGLTTTAYQLVRRERHVRVVDAADPRQGCSAGNAAMNVPALIE